MHKYFEKISLRQSIYVAKRISFLIDAGMSLPDALVLVASQMKRRGLVLKRMADEISHGSRITEVFSKAGIFGKASLPMIKIGEESGILAQSFAALSDELEKRSILKQKIIGAMLYPACISVGMIILIVVLMTVVFPKMLNVFTSLHAALPVSTLVLIWVSNFIRKFGLMLGLFLIACVVATVILSRRYVDFHFALDNLWMRVPVLSNLLRAYILAQISNVIGLLIINNSSLLGAISVAAETCSNQVYRRALLSVLSDVSGGAPLGPSFFKFPKLFPAEFSDIVSIGEQTAKLPETFNYVHTLYARDLDDLTKSLSASIEPVLMVVIGLAIGFVAFSVVTPMYNITSHLHGT